MPGLAGQPQITWGHEQGNGGPYVFVNESSGCGGAVQGPIAQHGEQNVAAPAGERDEGLVMVLRLMCCLGRRVGPKRSR